MNKNKPTYLIANAHFSGFPEKPEDYSEAELVPCPMCKKQMWFTIKKKQTIEDCIKSQTPYLNGCFECISRYILENKDSIGQIAKMDM